MTGGVYLLNDEQDAPFGRHPCVVVLELDGTKECIVVPAFTPGRETVEKAIAALVHSGLPRDSVVVTLDNRLHVSPVGDFDLHAAHWVTAQHQRIATTVLRRGHRIGAMRDSAFRQIVASLTALAKERPHTFSAPVMKKLAKLAKPPAPGKTP